jgi:hypothetical protein
MLKTALMSYLVAAAISQLVALMIVVIRKSISSVGG